MTEKKRILLAKMGLDCHDTGIITVAQVLRDAGYEVIYLGLHNFAQQVVKVAMEEDVDAIGISFLSGQHMTQMRLLLEQMRREGISVPLFCGGVIPDDDALELKEMGVAEIILPGTLSVEVAQRVGRTLAQTAAVKPYSGAERAQARPELSVTALDKCKAAIGCDDRAEALRQAQAIWDEWRPLHDLYVDMSGLFCTYIRDRLGEEAVADVWRFIGERLWKPILMQMKETGSTDLLVQVYAQFLRAHGHRFSVTEDDEKTIFVMHYCASGGMLMRDGKNEDSGRHPINIAVVKTKAEWTFHQPLSAYCVHTPLWMDILPREWGWDVFESSFGRQFDDDGQPVDEPCVAMIYKQPRS